MKPHCPFNSTVFRTIRKQSLLTIMLAAIGLAALPSLHSQVHSENFDTTTKFLDGGQPAFASDGSQTFGYNQWVGHADSQIENNEITISPSNADRSRGIGIILDVSNTSV